LVAEKAKAAESITRNTGHFQDLASIGPRRAPDAVFFQTEDHKDNEDSSSSWLPLFASVKIRKDASACHRP
jgi:hypothetical protein